MGGDMAMMLDPPPQSQVESRRWSRGWCGEGQRRLDLDSETLQSGETVQVEGLWWQILGGELGTGTPLAWGLCLPTPSQSPPPPGGLPGGGDRLSDETHYALNPPD